MAMEISLPPFTYSVMLLCIVLLSKHIFISLKPHQPLSLFSLYCRQLAAKVNNAKRSSRQQKIAGATALFVTLLPVVVILWLFTDFIEFPMLWHGVLLYLAIDGTNLTRVTDSISQALKNDNKYAAKQHLAPYVLRDVNGLSSLGITKASIEMLLLRSLQQLFTVSFYFLILGPIAALTVRLAMEMHYSWNVKRQTFRYFGLTASVACNLFQWLPIRVFCLLFILMNIGQRFSQSLRAFLKHFSAPSNDIAIDGLSVTLGIQLAGVAKYDDEKFRKKSFNEQSCQPEVSDIKKASSLVIQMIGFYLILLISIAGVLAYI